ncbi:hypothetical protein AX16_006937 [Volvariella volvacea WC 439]|nr:hypothetical protein AX16_006937 [Volvariella volvacea WC 439]
MQLLKWFSVAALAGLAVAAEGAEPPKELHIQVTQKPDVCKLTAQTGDSIDVHYTGTLFSNGKKFDSSRDRGQPFALTLGQGRVIRGWEEGLKGMCVGERRILTIPPDMAYGSRGFGDIIPAGSTLVFDVELLAVRPKPTREEL